MRSNSLSTYSLYLAAILCTGLPAAAVEVQVTGVNALYACTDDGCGGSFTGTLGGTLNSAGNLVGGQLVNLMCIDYQNEAEIPSVVYEANVSSIVGANADISNTRFGGAPNPDPTLGAWSFTTSTFSYSGGTLTLNNTATDVLARYQMVGYLASLYNTPASDNNAIQSAIWQMMSTNPPHIGTPGSSVPVFSGSSALLSNAAQWYTTTSASAKEQILSNYRVVTNVAPRIAGQYPAQIQEFLTVVPEPRYVAIMSLGFLALYGFRRRFAKAQQ